MGGGSASGHLSLNHAILNIRFGTLEDFDARFFNDEEVSWISHGLGGITAS
jgi:hypothetical protein